MATGLQQCTVFGRQLEHQVTLVQPELDPDIGAPVLGKALGIPELRTWRVAKFPLLWFYFERDGHLDVVRLLGERQDIETILGPASIVDSLALAGAEDVEFEAPRARSLHRPADFS